MIRTHSVWSVVVFALALGASAGAEEAKPEPWDQQKVSELWRELQHSASKTRDRVRAQPTDSLASGQSAAKQRYMDKLLQLEGDCRKLAGRVEKGAGREDTRGGFERADELSRDAAEEARRLFLPEEQIEQIKADRAAMQQIRLYYTGVELDQPSLVGPTRDAEPNGD